MYGRSVEDMAISSLRQSWGKGGYGKPFEDEMLHALKSSKFGRYIIPVTGTKEDKYNGTDFILRLNDRGQTKNVRVDLTSAFSTKKDNMPLRYESNISFPDNSKRNVKVGVRIGNSHNGFTPFQEPVIVLGLDVGSDEYAIARGVIRNGLNTRARDVLNLVTKAYLDFNREAGDRKNIEHILHYDSSYKVKKNTPASVKKCLRLAQDIDMADGYRQNTHSDTKSY